MDAPAVRTQTVRFGVFEFDLETGELRKRGIRIRLQGQPVEILRMLLARPGGVVTREELQNRLWPANTFVDFDRSLNAAVKRLRAALGDSAETPRFIETLARQGYRFVAPVDRLGTEVEPAAAERTIPSPRRKYVWPAALALAIAVTAVVVYRAAGLHPNVQGSTSKPIQSLVVLPLKSLSADEEQGYFADGMTDALNARLSGVSALRVISQTSSLVYKGSVKPVRQIARELKVDAAVEGSVLRSGERMRINVQLIDADSERSIWAQTYERDVRDVLRVQSDLARDIVEKIRVKLTRGEQKRLAAARPSNPEAHIAYAKGRFYWNKRTEDGLQKAVEFFQEAIDKDPDYALAYVGLADSWVPRAWYGYMPAKDAFPHAKQAITKALELEPDLAEAHTTLAFIDLYYDWDWAAADGEFRRAIELHPNYANAHHWYAEYLTLVGQHDAAIRQAEKARELDPLSSIINTWVGSRYYFSRTYDLALQQYQNIVELDPGFVPAHFALGQAYEQMKMFPDAIRSLRTAIDLSAGSPVYMAALAHAYGAAGNRSEALRLIGELRSLAAQRYVSEFDMAIAWLGAGDRDHALLSLEKAFEDRSPRMLFLKVDPRFDALRSTARFRAVVDRIGPFP